MSAAVESQPGRGDETFLDAVLDELLETRGVVAVAVVTANGEMVASRSHDRARLERTVSAITSALAAGQALGELLPNGVEPGGVESNSGGAASNSTSVMLMFEDGPILLTPLANPERVVVLALGAERDLGRARLMLRSLMARLSAAAAPVT